MTLADVPAGGAPLTVYPMDAATGTIRNDSRLNQILLVRPDPGTLDRDTRSLVSRASGGRHRGVPGDLHAHRVRRVGLAAGVRHGEVPGRGADAAASCLPGGVVWVFALRD